MAFLLRKKRSPFFYIRYRDLETGGWKDENTKLRADHPKEALKAVREANRRTSEEAVVRPSRGENFQDWAFYYISEHYRNEETKKRALYFWSTIAVWLHESGLKHPREVEYRHAQEYMNWRTGEGGEHAGWNTARHEVKFLSFLLNEAIRRGYTESNGIALARLPLRAAKLKREIKTEEIGPVRKALAEGEPWMATAFELQLHLGCRFSETRLSKKQINLKAGTITITDAKRQETDDRKNFTVPINPQLDAFLQAIPWYDGFTLPPLHRTMNRDYNALLNKGARGLTSHCLRVSFVSRCHRSGLGEHEAMRLVNHSTRLVHRMYSRLNVEDARRAMEKLPLPPEPETP
jgi:site-specific recombinase XerD